MKCLCSSFFCVLESASLFWENKYVSTRTYFPVGLHAFISLVNGQFLTLLYMFLVVREVQLAYKVNACCLCWTSLLLLFQFWLGVGRVRSDWAALRRVYASWRLLRHSHVTSVTSHRWQRSIGGNCKGHCSPFSMIAVLIFSSCYFIFFCVSLFSLSYNNSLCVKMYSSLYNALLSLF